VKSSLTLIRSMLRFRVTAVNLSYFIRGVLFKVESVTVAHCDAPFAGMAP
jgi:hypothetical protein